MSTYALDNTNPHGADHLDGLSGTFDAFTTARIAGLTELSGKRCLELGAGNGSVAVWMADRVGPDGHVTALDVSTERIPEYPRMTVLRRDLLTDPLPEGPFDLIHGRCVLGHLPNRDRLVPALAGVLAPGGVMLIEDPNSLARVNTVLRPPRDQPELADLWAAYLVKRGELFTAAGTDRGWAVRIHATMVEAGLDDVRTVIYGESWRGGEPGSRHAFGTLAQFRSRLIEVGMDAAAIDQLAAGLDNPELHVAGHLLYSCSGRKPGR